MSQIDTFYNKITAFISKKYCVLLFFLCFIATLKNYLSLTNGAEIQLVVFAIRFIAYIFILLSPVFLRILIKPYENNQDIVYAKTAFLICLSVILFNWYMIVLSISISLIYTILLRKNTLLSLISAFCLSLLGIYISNDFFFLMSLGSIVILLQAVKVRQLGFLLVNSIVAGIYSYIHYSSGYNLEPELALMSIILAFLSTFVYTTLYSGIKQKISYLMTYLFGSILLLTMIFIPASFRYIWVIIPFAITAYTTSQQPSTWDKALITHSREYFSSLILLWVLPIIVPAIFYYASINKSNFSDYNLQYQLIQNYVSWSDLGFVQRGLPGEIIERLFGFVIPIDNMLHISLTIHIVLAISIICLCIVLYRLIPSKDSISNLFIFILIGTIILPYIFTFTLRADLYLTFIALLCIILCVKNSNLIWLIPILSIVAVLIHPSYGFLIFSPVFIAMCYRAFINPVKHQARNTVILISSTALVIMLFVFFVFFSYRFAKLNVYEGVQTLLERSEGWVDGERWMSYNSDTGFNPLFSTVLYADPHAHTGATFYPDALRQMRKICINRLITLIPLILYYFYIFAQYSRQYKERHKRILCRLLPFALVAMAPLYIWEIDYGRWNLHLIFSMIIIMQIPALIGDQKLQLSKKENMFATFVFLISEIGPLIRWTG
ncbi:MAG: hypothetical protein K5877_11365 [Lachnospiraceae bacterium]|nr:hypothetical protein [Lachnospiraceae bacterium]